jgi:hypothetical protein
MAITTMDGLVAALAASQKFTINKLSATAEGAGTWHSLWAVGGFPPAGAAPGGTAIVPTKSTTGAIPFTASGVVDYLGSMQFRGATAGTIIIYDRLVTVSGLSGIVTTVDTAVNNTALTRYTSGAGVELWGEVYTAMGATAATLNVKYTDQDGNTNQAGTYSHPANALSVGQMFPITLAAGDSGVRAVTNYHFSVSTGTAGNLGFTLLKRLASITLVSANIGSVMNVFDHGITDIDANACLAMMVQCTTTSTGQILGEMQVIGG